MGSTSKDAGADGLVAGAVKEAGGPYNGHRLTIATPQGSGTAWLFCSRVVIFARINKQSAF